jgi:hypothetical protein
MLACVFLNDMRADRKTITLIIPILLFYFFSFNRKCRSRTCKKYPNGIVYATSNTTSIWFVAVATIEWICCVKIWTKPKKNKNPACAKYSYFCVLHFISIENSIYKSLSSMEQNIDWHSFFLLHLIYSLNSL